jgi:hypothetical protein
MCEERGASECEERGASAYEPCTDRGHETVVNGVVVEDDLCEETAEGE